MDKIKESVSVVFPVYNEEEVIETTIKSYYNEFKGKLDFEIIVKEDGSTDRTKEILKKLAKKYPLRVYMSNERRGYQWSVIEGIKKAKYEWIFLVDSDWQYRPYDFWKLAHFMKTHDIILGRRVKRMDPRHRILMSKGFNFLVRLLFNVPYRDIEPGFRLTRKKVLDEIIPSINCLSFFTSELVIRAHNLGYKVIEVPVCHFKRAKGATNVFYLYKIPFMVVRELGGLFSLKLQMSKRKNKYAG